ncbi:response regulator [Halobacteriovorax sp. GB3]|uniref:response regulator transcription factor n=1 Tax=Halobacteriovorax sp. GB3 TaxID=2719615 RepID=UPI0023621E34|nr:response regulator [Halobacteriovorax sp. GB3]MDD0853289.1 response regulator [Halobacteriovorax sp. GB3]
MTKFTHTIAVIDDDEISRNSIEAIVLPFDVKVIHFDSAESFYQWNQFDLIDGLVTDIRLKGDNGVTMVEEIRERGFHLPFVVISAYCLTRLVVKAMKLGAVDVLEKPLDEQLLWDSVSAMIRESDRVKKEKAIVSKIEQDFEGLDDIDRSIVHGIVKGMINKEIAAHLSLSTRSIEIRKNNILQKMTAGSMSEFIYFLSKTNLLEDFYCSEFKDSL